MSISINVYKETDQLRMIRCALLYLRNEMRHNEDVRIEVAQEINPDIQHTDAPLPDVMNIIEETLKRFKSIS